MRGYLAVLIVVLLAPGCAEFQDLHYRKINQHRARHAWKSFGTTCDAFGTPTRDYRRGWETGYYDVLTGSQPEPPAVPPKRYWAPRYQTPEGQAAIDDWYNGYRAGAMLATCSPIESELPIHDTPMGQPFAPEPPPFDGPPLHGLDLPEPEYVPMPRFPSFPVSVAPDRNHDRRERRPENVRSVSDATRSSPPHMNRVARSDSHRARMKTPSARPVIVESGPAAPPSTPPDQPSIRWGSKRTMFTSHVGEQAVSAPRRLTEPAAPTTQNMLVYHKPVPVADGQPSASEGWRARR